jgi:hypothetical protein
MIDKILHVLMKLTSARFLITVVMVFTFCWITNKSFNLMMGNIGNKDALPIIEKITMFLLGAFCTQVGNIVVSYFQRSDRQPEGGQK